MTKEEFAFFKANPIPPIEKVNTFTPFEAGPRCDVGDPNSFIGKKVSKYRPCGGAPKPFKSGNKFNTIKGVIVHPILQKPAFTFVEDESYVECRRCCLVVSSTK